MIHYFGHCPSSSVLWSKIFWKLDLFPLSDLGEKIFIPSWSQTLDFYNWIATFPPLHLMLESDLISETLCLKTRVCLIRSTYKCSKTVCRVMLCETSRRHSSCERVQRRPSEESNRRFCGTRAVMPERIQVRGNEWVQGNHIISWLRIHVTICNWVVK